MSTASNGRAREHRVMARMQSAGWTIVQRSAGSKGPVDFSAVHDDHGLAFIQVGTLRSKRLGPAERERFVDLSWRCSALPLVALCSPGVAPVFLIATPDVPSKWERWTV